MKLSKKTKDALTSNYLPGIAAEDLARKAGSQLWEAEWFVWRKGTAEQVKQLHKEGLSTYAIAEKLHVTQSFASRALRGHYA